MSRTRAASRWIRNGWELSIDLVTVLVLVVLTDLVVLTETVVDHPSLPDVLTGLVVFLDSVVGPIPRAVLGIAFVLFVPGYALVAALFPASGRTPATSDRGEPGLTLDRFFGRGRRRSDGRIDGLERVALSLGLSIALVPLVVVGLTLVGVGFALVPFLLTISVLTILLTGVAALRRLSLPPEERYHLPYRAWIESGTRSVTDAESRVDAVLNVVLAIAVVLAVGSLTFAVLVPPDGEQFTEFYVLDDDADGDLAATTPPDSLTPGSPEYVYVGIENYEHEARQYSVVVQLQHLEGASAEREVTDRVEVDRFSTTLAHNETSVQREALILSGNLTGQDLRLTFLLYEDTVPETPTRENAYRSLHLWVDVTAS